MSESCIDISKLNDFIFYPVSIYFHDIDSDTNNILLQDSFQINGTNAHKSIDEGMYSSSKKILQSTSVYCEQYNLLGKIDTFDLNSGVLTERKKRIKVLYDGYVFQLFAQYFALREMGYEVKKIRLYSSDDNKAYDIRLPNDNNEMLLKFNNLIEEINRFELHGFKQDNIEKCKKCIYRHICSYTDYDGEDT